MQLIWRAFASIGAVPTFSPSLLLYNQRRCILSYGYIGPTYRILHFPSLSVPFFPLSVLHRFLLHCLHCSVQLSHPRPNSVLYLFAINTADGLLVSLFELCQFFLGGCSVVGCVNGFFVRFFRGYFELVFCCCVAGEAWSVNLAMALSRRAADSSCSSSSDSSAEVLAAKVRRECGWMIDGGTRGS